MVFWMHFLVVPVKFDVKAVNLKFIEVMGERKDRRMRTVIFGCPYLPSWHPNYNRKHRFVGNAWVTSGTGRMVGQKEMEFQTIKMHSWPAPAKLQWRYKMDYSMDQQNSMQIIPSTCLDQVQLLTAFSENPQVTIFRELEKKANLSGSE